MKFLNPRWRKVIRDMWGNKSRTALVVLSIAVGIIAIGVVSASQEMFVRDLNISYSTINPANGSISVLDNFSDDLVASLENMREVDTAEGRRELTLRYRLNPTDEWDTLTLNAADDYDKVEINKVFSEAGEWPPPEQKLVVERTALDIMGVQIGDIVIVQTADGKEKTMEIVGAAHSQSGPPASLTGQATAFISRNTLEWLGESRDFNRIYFTVAENSSDVDHIENVADLVVEKIERAGLSTGFTFISTPGEHPVNDVLEPLLLILTALGGLALALSGFLVINVISATLAQQTRQIGIMKAVGARQGQLTALYFIMVLLYGVLALLVGLPLGALGAWGFSNLMASFFNFDLLGFSYPTSVLAVQMAVGLLIPVGAALYPIIIGTRVTVREAINEYGLGKGQFGTGLIDRLLQRIRGLSRPLMISLRNTFRRKTRLALTLTTLTLAGTTFITIFSVRDSMLTTLEDTLSIWNYDMQITFEQDNRIVEIDRIAGDIPGVEAVESWASGTVTRVRADGRESEAISVTAPPVDTQMLNVDILAGRWLRVGDTNALVVNTDFLNDEPDLQVGDQVVLKLNARETEWTIVGVVQGAMTGATVYANYDYFTQLTHKVGKARSAQVTTSFSAEELQDPQVLQALEDSFEDVGLKVSEIRTAEEIRARVSTAFNFLISFLLSMAIVLAVVGGLGLSGTMSINVLERVREIGVMRAVGASDWAVLKMVIVEGMIIGLLSWLAGSIIALPLSKVVSDQLGLALLDKALSFSFSFEGLVIWLVVACGLAAFASFIPARNASRLTVREVLAYE
jgi:putative ABC transport system permease protein